MGGVVFLGSETVWLVSIEGLISLKRLRRSPMDLPDIEALEALRDRRADPRHRSDNA